MDSSVENLLAETLANWRAWIPQNYQSLNQVPQVAKKLQEGMTNDSFLVTCADFKAVVRINCGYSSNLGNLYQVFEIASGPLLNPIEPIHYQLVYDHSVHKQLLFYGQLYPFVFEVELY